MGCDEGVWCDEESVGLMEGVWVVMECGCGGRSVVGWREYGCDGVWRCDGGSVGVMEGGW